MDYGTAQVTAVRDTKHKLCWAVAVPLRMPVKISFKRLNDQMSDMPSRAPKKHQFSVGTLLIFLHEYILSGETLFLSLPFH